MRAFYLLLTIRQRLIKRVDLLNVTIEGCYNRVTMLITLIAIGIGAAFGAWLRWGLGIWLNPTLSEMPLGTLSANLLGGYLVGLAVAFFMKNPSLSPEWRLLIVTGFLGGLTTFSTFSA